MRGEFIEISKDAEYQQSCEARRFVFNFQKIATSILHTAQRRYNRALSTARERKRFRIAESTTPGISLIPREIYVLMFRNSRAVRDSSVLPSARSL